jgi:hypothetical protein
MRAGQQTWQLKPREWCLVFEGMVSLVKGGTELRTCRRTVKLRSLAENLDSIKEERKCL